MGEELLSQGDIQGGVEHLAIAVSFCGQPKSLLVSSWLCLVFFLLVLNLQLNT